MVFWFVHGLTVLSHIRVVNSGSIQGKREDTAEHDWECEVLSLFTVDPPYVNIPLSAVVMQICMLASARAACHCELPVVCLHLTLFNLSGMVCDSQLASLLIRASPPNMSACYNACWLVIATPRPQVPLGSEGMLQCSHSLTGTQLISLCDRRGNGKGKEWGQRPSPSISTGAQVAAHAHDWSHAPPLSLTHSCFSHCWRRIADFQFAALQSQSLCKHAHLGPSLSCCPFSPALVQHRAEASISQIKSL